jgi:rhodanese-related sulfurtransferase
MVAIDHCNDCRRATGAILPVALITDITWVQATCIPRDNNGSEDLEISAVELFNFETVGRQNVYLSFFKSSPKRCRWFCSRCGTNLAYTVDEGAIPHEWGWPPMINFWLGTVNREDLEILGSPERMLWCEKGIPWVRELARNGAGAIPEHPTTKIDEVCKGTVPEESYIDNEPPAGSRGISQILDEARLHLLRVSPQRAWSEYLNQAPTAPVILVDIRPAAQRAENGSIEGSIVVERNVLEWRFDPRSDAHLPVAGRYDLRVIVFCQEGYTSSLAAKALQELGLKNATDMDGGHRAWKEAGLPTKL